MGFFAINPLWKIENCLSSTSLQESFYCVNVLISQFEKICSIQFDEEEANANEAESFQNTWFNKTILYCVDFVFVVV